MADAKQGARSSKALLWSAIRPALLAASQLRAILTASLTVGLAAGWLFAGAALTASLGAPASNLATDGQGAASSSLAKTKTVIIPVEGWSCIACAASVKKAIKSMDGVVAVEVDLATRTTKVTYTPDKTSPANFVTAIDQLGYKAGAPKEVE